MPWYRYTTSRQAEGGSVCGVFLPAVVWNMHHYFTLAAVYADGMVDCWGLMTLEQFELKVREGRITNSVPSGLTLSIHHLVRLTVASARPAGTADDLVKDVRSAIEELNGRPTAQQQMIEAIRNFEGCDSPATRSALIKAHGNLPGFHHVYLFGSRAERHLEVQRLLGLNLASTFSATDSDWQLP